MVRIAVGATPRDLFRESLVANVLLLVPLLVVAVASFGYLADVVLRVEPFATSPGELSGRAVAVALFVTGVLLVIAFCASVTWASRRIVRVSGMISIDRRVDGAIRRIVQRILLGTAVASLMLAGSALTRYAVDARRTFGFGKPDVHVVLPLKMHGLMFSDSEVGALTDLIERTPGVESVAQAELTPLMSLVALPTARIDVHVAGGGTPGIGKSRFFRNAVTSSYFETIGARMIAGRVFSESTNEVVVSRAAAATLGVDPAEILGLPITLMTADKETVGTVVGVVADIDYGEYDDGERLIVYQDWAHRGVYGDWVVRHRGDRSRLVDTIRSFTMVEDVMDLGTPIEAFRSQFATRRSAETILGVASLFAVVLAFSGVGATVARTMAQARHSMGVHLAVGATPADLARENLIPIAADVAIVTSLVCLVVIAIKIGAPGIPSLLQAWLAIPSLLVVLLVCSLLTYGIARRLVGRVSVWALVNDGSPEPGERRTAAKARI